MDATMSTFHEQYRTICRNDIEYGEIFAPQRYRYKTPQLDTIVFTIMFRQCMRNGTVIRMVRDAIWIERNDTFNVIVTNIVVDMLDDYCFGPLPVLGVLQLGIVDD